METVVIPAMARAVPEHAERLRECGQILHMIECKACHADHFAGYHRCRSRWCINCNHVRALLWVARLYPVLSAWLEAGNYVCMFNLTVRDGPILKDQMEYLRSGWRAMYHGSRARKERWKERFPGGIRSLEVTLGKNSGQWHPHYHCLVMQDTWEKDYPWVSELWHEICENAGTRGSVWLKQITGDNLMKAILESLKYILKPSKRLYSPENTELLAEAYNGLYGKRQVNTWGSMRGIAKQVEQDDAQEIDEKRLTDFICQQCGCTEGQLKSLLYNDLVGRQIFDIKKID